LGAGALFLRIENMRERGVDRWKHILAFAIEGRAHGLEEEECFTDMKALSH
jgi:hypothetical protein